jgi:hypothetical protein
MSQADAVSILYRDDNYGKMGYKLISEKTEVAQICMDKAIKVPFNIQMLEKNVLQYLHTLDKSKARIVILFVGWEQAKVILANAKSFEKSFVWIATESWGNRDIFLQDAMNPEALGAFSVNVEESDKKEVQEYVSTLRPKDNLRNQFFNESFQHYLKCRYGNIKTNCETLSYVVSCMLQTKFTLADNFYHKFLAVLL